MAFGAVDQRDLVTLVSDEIARAIIEGQIPPGSRLNEVRLAQEFKISRAPLREALRRLESQGLVEGYPRRGFFLRKLTENGLVELFELRLSLESTAGRRVAETLGEAELPRLEAQYEMICQAARAEDAARMIEQDFGFHRLVCELSGNSRLLRMFGQISYEIRFCMAHLRGIHTDMIALAESHAPLLDAFRQGSGEAYVRALSVHLDDARDKLIDALLRAEAPAATKPVNC